MATILVVEDEPAIRELIAMVLKRERFSVITADDASGALQMWRMHRDQIDLLISDVIMPGMDGPTLAKRLTAENPALAVLLISGWCDNAQFDLCRQFEFLPKPLDLSALIAAVQNLTSASVLKYSRTAGAGR